MYIYIKFVYVFIYTQEHVDNIIEIFGFFLHHKR